MKKYNVIVVFNQSEDQILMCYRTKNPYQGLYNLVGGKIEQNETDEAAAYRELFEETSITKSDINLKFLMTFKYHLTDIELQVYTGVLNKEVGVVEEVNTLHWIDASSDFFDISKYAGEGNIGHMVKQIKLHHDLLFKEGVII